jgi:dynamin 1-like protein
VGKPLFPAACHGFRCDKRIRPNVDLFNSDSLKLARSVDLQARRTIDVLTKLDIIDTGTCARDILTGHIYPLKLGFIGIVNQSQADINAGKSLGDALDN